MVSKIVLRSLGISIPILLLFSGKAFAAECDVFQKWLNLKNTPMVIPKNRRDIERNSDLQIRTFHALKKTSQAIYQQFLSGGLPPGIFDDCLHDFEDYKDLQEVLPVTFIDDSLELLGKSKSPTIAKMTAAIKSRQDDNSVLLFKLQGHYSKDLAPTTYRGGFNRGSESVFMNITKTQPNEWFVILSHELLHNLDDEVQSAVKIFADKELVLEIAHKKTSPNILTAAEKDEVDTWLTAGLDRSLLGEYRAWVLTFKIYLEGLQEGLWIHIPWLDVILAQKQQSESLQKFTFRYLDPRFVDPTEYPFSEPLLRTELKNIREELRKSEAPPPLYNLGSLYSS